MTDTPILDDAGTQSQLFSREAEEAVIGSVLVEPETYYDVAQFLQADDFYIIRNRWVWEIFQALIERRSKIDYTIVVEELKKARQLEEIGGAAYITSLFSQTASPMNAVAYGRLVQEAAIRRRMLTAANQLAKLAHNQTQSIDTIIGEAEKSIFGLSERRNQSGPTPISKVASSYYDRIDLLSQQDEEISGVPTGLTDLDKMLNGLQKSDLLIVAGRPGMGKTGFMLSVAKNAALKHRKHVAMFSLEMSNEQLLQRLVSQETGINSQKLRTGKLDSNEWRIFTQAVEVLSGTHIWLDDTPAITPLQLRTKCRRLHLEFQLDLILVDYLQLMSGDSRNDNRVQEVSYISRTLKVLARELNVPVLAAAQLSRAVEQRTDKRPQLSDLRESGSLEQDADIVMFINRPDANEKDSPLKNMAELIVAKHRNGPVGSIDLVFMNNLARFENAATHGQRP